MDFTAIFDPTSAYERAFQRHLLGLIGIPLLVLFSFFNSGALVRQRTIPTKRSPLVGEVTANFSG
jgi:hypothetical protein